MASRPLLLPLLLLAAAAPAAAFVTEGCVPHKPVGTPADSAAEGRWLVLMGFSASNTVRAYCQKVTVKAGSRPGLLRIYWELSKTEAPMLGVEQTSSDVPLWALVEEEGKEQQPQQPQQQDQEEEEEEEEVLPPADAFPWGTDAEIVIEGVPENVEEGDDLQDEVPAWLVKEKRVLAVSICKPDAPPHLLLLGRKPEYSLVVASRLGRVITGARFRSGFLCTSSVHFT